MTLESGQNGVIIVELNDTDAGDSVTLHPAPGYRTSCLSISGNYIVTVDTSNLLECDIA